MVPAALERVAPRLACANCGGSLAVVGSALRCERGHSFDVARHGYVALGPPRGRPAPGDTSEMVAAREAFLAAGHYAPLEQAIVDEVRVLVGPAEYRAFVADVGAGTGRQLAALLDALDGAYGVALDASRPALRRAARAHPRVAAVACDVWRRIPIQDDAAGLALNVFAPRNGAELARILAPGGALIVVTPTERHLAELVRLGGMIAVDPAKRARLDASLSPALEPAGSRDLEFEMTLSQVDAEALVAMGPSAHHVSREDVRSRLGGVREPISVTASVAIEVRVPVPELSG